MKSQQEDSNNNKQNDNLSQLNHTNQVITHDEIIFKCLN